MVLRDPDPGPLLAAGVDLGLHLELGDDAADEALGEQLAGFEAIFATRPTYLDGHHHCHAAADHSAAIARQAAALGLAIRSVDDLHRRTVRSAGAWTPDRLIGRLREEDDALPGEIEAWLEERGPPPGVTEWFVHPGHPDPTSGSSYDLGRAEDLELLLRLADNRRLRAVRGGFPSPS